MGKGGGACGEEATPFFCCALLADLILPGAAWLALNERSGSGPVNFSNPFNSNSTSVRKLYLALWPTSHSWS